MAGTPRRCPSCGGACGYTKRRGCRYVAGETEVERLQRALRDARLLISGALHLAQYKPDIDAWANRAMKWQHETLHRGSSFAAPQARISGLRLGAAHPRSLAIVRAATEIGRNK